MPVLDILRMGNPILQHQARLVEDPLSPEIAALARDMVETMLAAPGVGLAAPQVGFGLQMVVFEVKPERDGESVERTILLNPEIEPLEDVTEDGWEGCLSLPGLMGKVPRWRRIGYRGLGLDGKLIEREAVGFHARVVQHECDHLIGQLYPMRMRSLKSLAYVDELNRLMAERQEETPE